MPEIRVGRGRPRLIRVALATVAWSLCGALAATPSYSQKYAAGHNNVLVDYSVIESLGPPPNLPVMLRPGQKGAPIQWILQQGATSRQGATAPQGATAQPLLPAPQQQTSVTRFYPPGGPVALSPAATPTQPGGLLPPPGPDGLSRVTVGPSGVPAVAAPAPAPQPVTEQPAQMAKAAPAPEPAAKAEPAEPEPKVEAPPPPQPVETVTETATASTSESSGSSGSESSVTVPVKPQQVAAATTGESAGTSESETPAASETQQAALTTGKEADAIGQPDPDRARILFGEESTDLPTGVEGTLNAIATRLNDDASLRLQLHAYASGTAETASRARRMSLSRALVVRSYLMQQGIRSTRMDVRALGNKTEETPADRVDVIVVAK